MGFPCSQGRISGRNLAYTLLQSLAKGSISSGSFSGNILGTTSPLVVS